MGFEKFHNKKQCEIIELNREIQPEILFLDGAFGSGKTYISIPLFMAHVKKRRDQGVKFIMSGHTLGSLKRNVLDPMREIYGIDTKISSEDNSFMLFGNKICCFGTDKENSYEAIRGVMESYGHYANELTLSRPSALKEIMGRCRGESARFFWEMNPAGPQHTLYKTYIERHNVEGNNKLLVRVNSSMYDNDKAHGGFLPDEYIRRMENDYQGIWKRKYIMGEWAAIEGQIYFLENLKFYDDELFTTPGWSLGVVYNGFLDPATGSKAKTGCYTAALAGALKGNDIYITDIVLKKIMPDGLKGAVKDLLLAHNYAKFGVEDNFSQAAYVVDPLRQAHPFLNIVGQSAREDKLSRLCGMQPIVNERVYFPRKWMYERNTEGWLFLQQLCNITPDRKIEGESDDTMVDGPDALEGLIRTFRTYMNQGAAPVMIDDISQEIKNRQIW
jgi:hypothetical protein